MVFFVDTNIPLGYTVIHDKWHDTSKKFIENNKGSVFWSNLVRDEYSRKLENIIDEIEYFLEASEDILLTNQKDFVNFDEFRKFILKRTRECEIDPHKKQKILEHFWKRYNFNEGISGIVSSRFTKYE